MVRFVPKADNASPALQRQRKAAAAAQSDVLIAGVAGLVAGAISMAAGATMVGAVINLAEPGTG